MLRLNTPLRVLCTFNYKINIEFKIDCFVIALPTLLFVLYFGDRLEPSGDDMGKILYLE